MTTKQITRIENLIREQIQPDGGLRVVLVYGQADGTKKYALNEPDAKLYNSIEELDKGENIKTNFELTIFVTEIFSRELDCI